MKIEIKAVCLFLCLVSTVFNGQALNFGLQSVSASNDGEQYLEVDIVPKDATVLIDGIKIKLTNGHFSAPYKVGEHSYEISADLYESEKGVFTIGYDIYKLAVTLAPSFGLLSITSAPRNGASVFLDDDTEPIGRTPITTGRLAKGIHHIRLLLDNYQSRTVVQEITGDGTTQQVCITLQQGSTPVTVARRKAAIAGRETNQAPLQITLKDDSAVAAKPAARSVQRLARTVAPVQPKKEVPAVVVPVAKPTEVVQVASTQSSGKATTIHSQNATVIVTVDTVVTKPVLKSEEPKPINSGAVAVDLGLSVKWADRNVGATGSEDCGGHYGWADPSGMKFSSDYDDYPNDTPPAEISGTSLDIAHANWGGNWRMPTLIEVKELLDSCTFEWTKEHNIKGGKFTSKKNGKSIFLPASGYRGGTDVFEAEMTGYYWSASCNVKYTGRANALSFTTEKADWIIINRSGGFNIRPVTK